MVKVKYWEGKKNTKEWECYESYQWQIKEGEKKKGMWERECGI